jgi:hypothetical protein
MFHEKNNNMNGNVSLPTDPYHWTIDSILEIRLPNPDAFLKIRETLTRIGVASKQDNTLWQSVHILHKRGNYYLLHFKEFFGLDNRETDITVEDIRRRNTIAKLLEQWGLCQIVSKEELITTNMNNIKIVPHKEKDKWQLKTKYTMRNQRTSA